RRCGRRWRRFGSRRRGRRSSRCLGRRGRAFLGLRWPKTMDGTRLTLDTEIVGRQRVELAVVVAGDTEEIGTELAVLVVADRDLLDRPRVALDGRGGEQRSA